MDRVFPRRPSREVEAAYALACGFILNGVLLVTDATAGVVGAGLAISQTYAFAGALGGLTSALIHFVAIVFAEDEATRAKVMRATVEGLCSVVVGACLAHYFTRYIAAWVPRVDPADILWLGYCIGVFAWRVMPGLLRTAQAFAQPRNLLSLLLQAARDALNKWAAASGSERS